MAMYIGPGSVKKIKSILLGVGGSVKTAKAVYIGVGGAVKKVWPVAEYGETVNLLTYGNKTSFCRGSGGSTIILPDTSDTSQGYRLDYKTSGTMGYRATNDMYDLTNYNYLVLKCYSGAGCNASYYASVSASQGTYPRNDTIRGTSTAIILSDEAYQPYVFLIDISALTGKYYIKLGVWVSGATGYLNFYSKFMKMYVDKPSVTYNKFLTFK